VVCSADTGKPPALVLASRGNARQTDPAGEDRRRFRHRGRASLAAPHPGRSRGGLATKIHLAVDAACRPLAILITAGQAGDSPPFVPVLEQIRIRHQLAGRPLTRPGAVAGDAAHSSGTNRAYPRRHGIKAVISEPQDQAAKRKNKRRASGRPVTCDADLCRKRSIVETRHQQDGAGKTLYTRSSGRCGPAGSSTLIASPG
jgi:transposase